MHAKPAQAGERVNWSGIHFAVPVGWYPVRVCFATTLAMPVGYLTTQAPRAQCHGNTCGPPVSHLGDSDVVVVANRTSTSLTSPIHPNSTVAGRPAQITTSTGGQFGSSETVEARVLLPHAEILHVQAYLGPVAAAQRQSLLVMLRSRRPQASG
jgi:hypothetical protein